MPITIMYTSWKHRNQASKEAVTIGQALGREEHEPPKSNGNNPPSYSSLKPLLQGESTIHSNIHISQKPSSNQSQSNDNRS